MSASAYKLFNLPFSEVYKQFVPALQWYDLVQLQLTSAEACQVTSAKDLAAHL